MMFEQHGQRAPVRLVVPSPLPAAFADAASPPSSTPNTTPVPVAFGSIVNRTRFPGRRHSQRVFNSGSSARHRLHSTVRAQRYAAAGFATHRGFSRSAR